MSSSRPRRREFFPIRRDGPYAGLALSALAGRPWPADSLAAATGPSIAANSGVSVSTSPSQWTGRPRLRRAPRLEDDAPDVARAGAELPRLHRPSLELLVHRSPSLSIAITSRTASRPAAMGVRDPAGAERSLPLLPGWRSAAPPSASRETELLRGTSDIHRRGDGTSASLLRAGDRRSQRDGRGGRHVRDLAGTETLQQQLPGSALRLHRQGRYPRRGGRARRNIELFPRGGWPSPADSPRCNVANALGASRGGPSALSLPTWPSRLRR